MREMRVRVMRKGGMKKNRDNVYEGEERNEDEDDDQDDDYKVEEEEKGDKDEDDGNQEDSEVDDGKHDEEEEEEIKPRKVYTCRVCNKPMHNTGHTHFRHCPNAPGQIPLEDHFWFAVAVLNIWRPRSRSTCTTNNFSF